MDYQLHHRILVWMETAAENLRQSLSRKLEVQQKSSAHDLVTEMDKATEKFFVEKIRKYYPTHRVVGEEGLSDKVEDTKGMLWVIDPIDGTLNFVKQKRNFGIMIGLFEDGKPVAGYIYDVMQHDLYYGIVGDGVYVNGTPIAYPDQITTLQDSVAVGNVRMYACNFHNSQRILQNVLGIRAHGSAALEVIDVLCGRASVYFSYGLAPWDAGAGHALCAAMGLKATQADGSPLSILEKTPVVFCHPNVHDDVIRLLNEES